MHYSIILNPTAGNGYAKTVWPQIKQALDQGQVDYDSQVTKYPDHATYLAQKLAAAADPATTVVIAIGGDGTLHEVLNGLMKVHQSADQLPLAYIPAGTGNDFARGYGISLDPLTALQQILAADSNQRINVGHYHDAIKKQDNYFVNNVGIGFDAAIVSRTNASQAKKKLNKHHIGRFSYLSQALGVLYDQQPFTLMLEEGHSRTYFPKAYIVIASNHPFIGGGFKIAPGASVKEPALDLVIAERKNWVVTAWQLWKFARGKLIHSRAAHHFHAARFHYVTTSLEFGQVDGEEMGNRFMDLTLSVASYPFHQQSTLHQK